MAWRGGAWRGRSAEGPGGAIRLVAAAWRAVYSMLLPLCLPNHANTPIMHRRVCALPCSARLGQRLDTYWSAAIAPSPPPPVCLPLPCAFTPGSSYVSLLLHSPSPSLWRTVLLLKERAKKRLFDCLPSFSHFDSALKFRVRRFWEFGCSSVAAKESALVDTLRPRVPYV